MLAPQRRKLRFGGEVLPQWVADALNLGSVAPGGVYASIELVFLVILSYFKTCKLRLQTFL